MWHHYVKMMDCPSTARAFRVRDFRRRQGASRHPTRLPAADARPVLLAGGFGLRGASCRKLLPSAFAPGDVAAADASALLQSNPEGFVLVGSAVEAHGTTLELARLTAGAGGFVAAALATPFEFEGQRKAAAAHTAVKHLLQHADLVVLVNQEVLVAAAPPEATLAGATHEANTVLTQSVAALRFLHSCAVRLRCDAAGTTRRVRCTLAQELAALGVEGPAAFGSASAPLAALHTPAAAVAAFSAASCAAVATPFLAHARVGNTAGAAQSAGTCLCLVRSQAPLPDTVEDAAVLALSSFLPGFSFSLASAVDSSVPLSTLAVDLIIASRAARPPQASSPPADSTPKTEPRKWQSEGESRRVQSVDSDLREEATGDRSVAPLFARLLGVEPATPSVSQRALAALASDRAASRVVTHLSWHDGGSYEGEIDSDGIPHGVGRRIYANGAWYAGEWRHGQRHGWGVSQTGSERMECVWLDGRPQAP